ncbi:MAG: hypothetical protein JRD89_16215, partial [Deltaproteobacteria bacterium]|nr:hypothetical protein [Deltaproteobacteria bacterium]
MASGLPDWHRSVRLTGKFGTDYIPIVTDEHGNLFAVFKGTDGVELRTVKVDADGSLLAKLVGGTIDTANIAGTVDIGSVADKERTVTGSVNVGDVSDKDRNILGSDGVDYRPVAVDSDGIMLSRMKGHDGTQLRDIRVDTEGRMISLMTGAGGVALAVDEEGRIRAVMQGEHDTTLRTLKTDEEGRLQAVMVGSYEGTPVPVATDADGRLRIVDLYQNSIMPDETEAQTWDTPIGSLLSNLNRIRYAIVHMSGEAWGTFSHSI